MEKNVAKQCQKCGTVTVLIYWVGLTKKMAFEPIPGKGEVVAHLGI